VYQSDATYLYISANRGLEKSPVITCYMHVAGTGNYHPPFPTIKSVFKMSSNLTTW